MNSKNSSSDSDGVADFDREILALEEECRNLSKGLEDIGLLESDVHHGSSAKLSQTPVAAPLVPRAPARISSPAPAKTLPEIKVELSPEKDKAWVSISPFGESLLQVSDLLAAIKKAGVRSGIDEPCLQKLIQDPQLRIVGCKHHLCATGVPARDGVDAREERLAPFQDQESFERRFPHEKLPQVHEFKYFALVQKGEPLVRISPEILGQDGLTVTGERLPARRSQNLFRAKANITTLKEGDKLVYQSDVEGIAVIRDQTYQVLPHRDTLLRVLISQDLLSAKLSILPPTELWKLPTLEELHGAIKNAGVLYGVLHEEIEKEWNCFLKEKQAREFICAVGTAAEHGQDGSLVFHIEVSRQDVLAPDDHGRIDYRKRKNVIWAEAGMLLCSHRLPTLPRAKGMTVTAQNLPSLPGRTVAFAPLEGLQSEKVDDLTTRYFAKIEGEVNYNPKEHSLSVLNTKTVDAIDLSLGNLTFSGNVIVKGNIENGMEVNIKGKLHVMGAILASKVTVEGSVICEGGVVTRENGFVHCTESLTTRFIENSNVKAGGDIVVERAIMSSMVTTWNNLTLTHEKGVVTGSMIQARCRVMIHQIGNEVSARSVIQFSDDPQSLERYHEIACQTPMLVDGIKKIDLMIQHIIQGQNTSKLEKDDMVRYRKWLLDKRELMKKLQGLRQESTKILGATESSKDSELVVTGKVFPKTMVCFGRTRVSIEGTKTSVRFKKDPFTGTIRESLVVSMGPTPPKTKGTR